MRFAQGLQVRRVIPAGAGSPEHIKVMDVFGGRHPAGLFAEFAEGVFGEVGAPVGPPADPVASLVGGRSGCCGGWWAAPVLGGPRRHGGIVPAVETGRKCEVADGHELHEPSATVRKVHFRLRLDPSVSGRSERRP